MRPILRAGSLDATVCSFARDLGRDEVRAGQPQIGAGGRLVREGVYRAAIGGEPPASDRTLEAVLGHIVLSNTVPYKPPGNKAYSEAVKRRFRPLIAEFLAGHWRGNRVLCLGTEAFKWFTPDLGREAVDAFWAREDRYEAELPCEIVANQGGEEFRKRLILCPLPHPSPLNQRWYGLFPELLDRRLRAAFGS